jgi:hypothetical protein
VDEALREAYRAARYRVADGDLLLAVDQPSPALAALLRRLDAPTAALFTAFNPSGLRQADALNHAAHVDLLHDLHQAGYHSLAAVNEDPRGQWPDEPSLLVPAISLAAARALAARYRQLAFLWMDAASATPRLFETAAPDPPA